MLQATETSYQSTQRYLEPSISGVVRLEPDSPQCCPTKTSPNELQHQAPSPERSVLLHASDLVPGVAQCAARLELWALKSDTWGWYLSGYVQPWDR